MININTKLTRDATRGIFFITTSLLRFQKWYQPAESAEMPSSKGAFASQDASITMMRTHGLLKIATLQTTTRYHYVRAVRESDGSTVIVKTLAGSNSSYECAIGLKREKALLHDLKSHFTLSLAQEQHLCDTPSIVFEDFDAEPLERVIATNLPGHLGAIRIAIQIARGLQILHANNLVHCGLNPAGILVKQGIGEIRLLDLSMAVSTGSPPDQLMGQALEPSRVAYLAPEIIGQVTHQTHNTWTAEPRADLYAFGCILYELLTGTPTFKSANMRELIHAHLARQPIAPHRVRAHISVAISDITMKLLAKEPDHRYQSIQSVLHDLEFMERRLMQGDEPPFEFNPGTRDYLSTFRIADGIFGRDVESARLTNVFTAVDRVGPGFALVSGNSGIGKTELIKSVLARTHFAKAWILTGKHDQVVERQPFATLAAMFTPIVENMLASSISDQARYRQMIQALAGDSLPILTEMIPGLTRLTGTINSNAEEAPETVARRLRIQIKNLLRGFATQERPIVMFFDDLQWSNTDELSVIRDIALDVDLQHVFVIGALRTQDNKPPALIKQWLNQVDQQGLKPTRIKLRPLNADAFVNVLSASQIHCDVDVTKIAKCIVSRCQGNPFQIRHYLNALQQVGIIAPHPDNTGWLLRTETLKGLISESTDNLLVKQLTKLPGKTLDLLCHASCLGAQISLRSLSTVLYRTHKDLELALQPAVDNGLVRKLIAREGVAFAGYKDAQYAFIHDRVQQSAYQTLEEDDRAALHLKIGRSLLKKKGTNDDFFIAIEQLNYAHGHISDKSERQALAELNLDAGLRARHATAFAQALSYFRHAADLCSPQSQTASTITLTKLRFHLAEAEYLAGDRVVAKELVQNALMYDTSPLDRADLFDLLIVLNTLEGHYAEAIRVGRSALQEFGLSMPQKNLENTVKTEVATARQLMLESDNSANAEYVKANELTTATFRIMISLLPPTDFAQPLLNSWLAAKGVILSQELGHSPESLKLLINLANVLAEHGDYLAADTLAKQALTSVPLISAERMLPRILYTFACYIHHWTHPINESKVIGEQAFRSCEESGEDQYAGYVLAFHRTINELFVPESLQRHHERLLGIEHFANRTRNSIASDVVSAALCAVRHLNACTTDKSSQRQRAEGTGVEYLTTGADLNRKASCLVWVLSAAVALVENDAESALGKARKAFDDLSFVSSTVLVAMQPFIEVLAILRSAQYEWVSIQSTDQSRVVETLSQFSTLSSLCSENFSAASALLEAETARARGDLRTAIRLYDKAIVEGSRFGFPPIDALACESAARLWFELGRNDIAIDYLTKAYHKYRDWGAIDKSICLSEELGENQSMGAVSPDYLPPSLSDAADALNRQMMIDAVIAVGSEVHLAELLRKLILLLIEGTGADKAILMLDHGSGLQVEARAHVEADALDVHVESVKCAAENLLPLQVIQRVSELQEPITVTSPWDVSDFASDSYIVGSSISALMCLPLIQDSKLVGIVYLENAQTKGAFSPTQAGVATFLAAQAALAVTNAILVENLEDKVSERTREVAQRSDELEIALQRAERESQAKTSMLTNVSHELRTPLNAIIGFSDTLNLLHKNTLTTAQAAYMRSREPEYINDIFEASTYLLRLIEDLLDLSQVEHGGIQIECSENLVEDSLQWAYNLLKREAEKKDIQLQVESNSIEETFFGDPHRIKQVLANLVNNAIKFTPVNGKVTLTATASKSSIIFVVEDSGGGVKEDDRERIFDPYIRLAPSSIPGSGIGLTLCKHLIELHGGRVFVSDSSLGGALFGFELPAGSA